MPFQIEFETKVYSWNYNSLYGVGFFSRKSDGYRTLLETGTDCQDTRRSFRRLWQKEKDTNKRDTIFNMIAGEYTYEE